MVIQEIKNEKDFIDDNEDNLSNAVWNFFFKYFEIFIWGAKPGIFNALYEDKDIIYIYIGTYKDRHKGVA